MMKNIKFLIFLLFASCIVAFGQKTYKLAEQDSMALVAFYNATDGANWKSNQDGFSRESLSAEYQLSYQGGFSKWFQGPVKNWYGIDVALMPVPNSTDSVYRITKLAPVIGRRSDGENLLKGYLPLELGFLTEMIVFRVNGNIGLGTTQVPDEVFNPKLEYFDVEGCGFEGDIPEAMRNCKKLQEINIRYNKFVHMPVLDFLPESFLRQATLKYWFYSCNFPLSLLEKTVDYFYSISATPKQFFIEMRDNNNVGDESEVVAPLGSAVDLVCNDAGSKSDYITYQWYRNDLSRIGRTKQNYSITSVQATDYAKYKVRITNDYVKAYDQNSNWGEVYTKEINLVQAPVAPVVKWAKSSYSGFSIQLRMSKTMRDSYTSVDKFKVMADGKQIEVLSAISTGRLKRDLILTLSEAIKPHQNIFLSVVDDVIADKNGAILKAFSDTVVTNNAKQALSIASAKTTKDGGIIEVTFNGFIDPTTLSASDFKISGLQNYVIQSVVLKNGVLETFISKTVRIILNEPIENPEEEIKLTYTAGKLSGLYAGAVSGFENYRVENTVEASKTDVKLTFTGNKTTFANVVLKGSWLTEAVQLYDDGTYGDVVSKDNTWSRTFSLPNDAYTWNIYSRKSELKRDTVKSIDPITGIETLTIIPQTIHTDSLINTNKTLSFGVNGNTITGDTHFEINNKTVIFRVSVPNATTDVYLMGINDDWGIGNLMRFNGTHHLDTIMGYSVGDVINYNYRKGNKWENTTPDSRKYTVVEGDNIITDVFGVFSALQPTNNEQYSIFYNRNTNQLKIIGLKEAGINYKLMAAHGSIIAQGKLTDNNLSIIQLSQLPVGIYFIALTSNKAEIITTQKFIITN